MEVKQIGEFNIIINDSITIKLTYLTFNRPIGSIKTAVNIRVNRPENMKLLFPIFYQATYNFR